jgi:enoyl-CoA hydratase/carnithine racemase
MAKAQVSAAGDVAELVISAPPLNLFDGQLITDLEAALDELDALIRTRAARAVLLRAEGKVFCAGVDVHEFQGLGPAQGAVLMARFLALVQTLERLPVPTMAVVHALNLTIGFELCLGCDLMWAAEDASFGLAAADAVTAREVGQIFATRDLPAGLESLLEQGPNQAIFEGR